MRRIMGPALGLVVACVSTAVIAGGIESGLQVGDKAGAFKVKDITGPKTGTSLCYR